MDLVQRRRLSSFIKNDLMDLMCRVQYGEYNLDPKTNLLQEKLSRKDIRKIVTAQLNNVLRSI